MPQAAIAGSPVSHSLSPVLHTAAYRALGLPDWHYGRIECDEDGLAAVLDGLGPDWAGLSLTMPLKRRGLDLSDEATGLADAVGAANTLLLSRTQDGTPWRLADNTDVGGIVDALRAAGVASVTGPVAVLGAGGTAQAALAALQELDVLEPYVMVRDLGRTRDLQATADRIGVSPHMEHWPTGPGPAADTLAAAELVVSTAPAGAADTLAELPFSAEQTVLDVVYEPWPTALAAAARSAGATVVSGLDLLVHQAVRQVGLMTGHSVEASVLYAAVQVER